MVATQFDSLDASRRFMIRPNCSMPWRAVKRFYFGMVLVSVGIASIFAFHGAWMILPFAGLEMLALGSALYVVALRGCRWQTISIRSNSVDIAEGRSGNGRQQTFRRAWAQVDMQPAPVEGHPARLVIRSHGQAVEIGSYLNETEKLRLAQELREALRWQD
ncbi:MAG: DUF2244 domain-containing protein [Thiogranum sp.]|nr:DUF2244 domain-containing protein [Thiogranum sp.]